MEEYNILDKLYIYREEENLENIKSDMYILGNRLKDIERKEIDRLISNISRENANLKQQLRNSIDDIVANYNIMLAYYNKKYYKQGFEDAIYLESKCKTKE